MITSRRDYLLRIIDEVGRMLARVVFKRSSGAYEEALEIVVQGMERLFSLERHQLFQLTPDQQRLRLALDEPPDVARDKLLVYASLSLEAGIVYAQLANNRMAQASYWNALSFALAADEYAVTSPPPAYAPHIDHLVSLIGYENLDAGTRRRVDDRD